MLNQDVHSVTPIFRSELKQNPSLVMNKTVYPLKRLALSVQYLISFYVISTKSTGAHLLTHKTN